MEQIHSGPMAGRTVPRASASLSEPGTRCHYRKPPFEMPPGLTDVPTGDRAHGDGRGDDDVGQLSKQILTAAAHTLAGIQAPQPDKRLRRLADLFGQLQQPHLDRDIAVMLMQAPDVIPHDFLWRCACHGKS